jgi:hypothetical protein
MRFAVVLPPNEPERERDKLRGDWRDVRRR